MQVENENPEQEQKVTFESECARLTVEDKAINERNQRYLAETFPK